MNDDYTRISEGARRLVALLSLDLEGIVVDELGSVHVNNAGPELGPDEVAAVLDLDNLSYSEVIAALINIIGAARSYILWLLVQVTDDPRALLQKMAAASFSLEDE